MQEVMDCYDFNQLQPGESQDQCGFAAVALCFAAGQPGKGARKPVQWAIQMMASWYTEYNGTDIPSNTRGMSLDQLYKLITEKGGHYQAIDAHATSIASWVTAKYPVIIAVTESSVHDVHLNGSPYTWNTSGLSHIFTVTGIAEGHIFLCRDTVNQHPGSPYSYDGDKLSYLSATVFVPDWMPRPTSGIAPQGEDMPKVITIHDVESDFEELDHEHWKSRKTGKVIHYGLLEDYKTYGKNELCGLSYLGHPVSPEITIGPNKAKQHYQFGVRCWDNGHTYSLDLYAAGSEGQDPGLARQQAKIEGLTAANNMQAQKILDLQAAQPVSNQEALQALADMHQVKAIADKY